MFYKWLVFLILSVVVLGREYFPSIVTRSLPTKRLASCPLSQTNCQQVVPGGESKAWIEERGPVRIDLEDLKVSRSKAHEPKEEEDGKTKTMKWISVRSAGEVLKENSRNFLNQWG